MPDPQVRTRSGGATRLPQRALDSFTAAFRGQLLRPDSPGYDAARGIWNAMIDRRPALIARCATAADVALAVRLAASHDLLVAVRGGGHNIAGKALCDEGLVIDLSAMNAVEVDPAARLARVGPGASLGDVDRATQAHGLATPVGINSTTGIAGLTLGGGFGWLSRSLGLTIDNLAAADVVTADGTLLRASASEHPDLFWGIRGGGGNFGVVTSFEFQLHPVGPQVLSGLIVHPLDEAPAVLRFYRDFLKRTPDEFVCWVVLRKAPPLPFLPAEWHGREIVVLAVCYAGTIADGERIAKPLRDFGHPIADVIQPHPFTAWQAVLDPLLTPGMRNYWKSHDFHEISDGLIDVVVDHARRIPDPQTEIALAQLGGAVSRVPADATAYAHRDAQFVMNVHGRWADPALDATCVGWARQLFQAAAPFATGGVYVNFLTEDEQSRVPAAYAGNYARLVALKRKYDPDNLFRINQNIGPSA
jgi:FAD/FMN-containing dehydrogenase